MIFPKFCNIDRNCNVDHGFILLDVILATAFSAVFVCLLAEITNSAFDIFDRSLVRDRLLDIYESHADEARGLLPDESVARDGFEAKAFWYGNDRVEIVATAFDPSASTTFVMVKNYPYQDIGLSAGTPLCSPRFMEKNTVGSYGYIDASHSTGAGSVYSDVHNIEVSSSATHLPLNQSVNLTDLHVRGKFAYLSADSSTSADPDIFIADISDHDDPDVFSALNTGPGISALALSDEVIYGAAASAAAQLHVIGMNGRDLVLVTKYRLPLPYATATSPYGSAIFYSAGKVYLGTEKWDGEEFNIIDVSDPLSPRRLGGLEVGSKVGAIYVRGGIAYLSTAGEGQSVAVNVSDPSHPVVVSSFSPSGWQRQEGRSFSSFEDTSFFGRTSGGYNVTGDHELFVFATGSPLFTPLFSSDIAGGSYGIVADRSFIFTGTRTIGGELTIYSRDLSSAIKVALHSSGGARLLTCDHDRLYVLDNGAPVIYSITLRYRE